MKWIVGKFCWSKTRGKLFRRDYRVQTWKNILPKNSLWVRGETTFVPSRFQFPICYSNLTTWQSYMYCLKVEILRLINIYSWHWRPIPYIWYLKISDTLKDSCRQIGNMIFRDLKFDHNHIIGNVVLSRITFYQQNM